MKQGKNAYYLRARISARVFRRLLQAFALDLTASDTARLTGLSVRSVNPIYLKIRRRLGLAPSVQGKAQLYSGEATGQIVQLPGWQYPAVIDTATGQIDYDNYGGSWGAQSELHKLLQAYAIEKARIEARKAGHTITEQTLADGSVKLTIQMGGVA
jgi:hypothetical protein